MANTKKSKEETVMCNSALKTSLCSLVFVAASVAQAEPTATAINVSIASSVQQCMGTLVDVTGASSDERGLACLAASQAVQLLGRCQIALRGPLHVIVSDELRHPSGWPTLGFFEAKRERVTVAGYEKMRSLTKGTPFDALSKQELFKSVIVHEVIHGVLHQNSTSHVLSHPAGEYLAYALQMESLPAHERDSYLRLIDKKVDTADMLFSDLLLLADPFLFAAQAYAHFKAAPDSCAQAKAMLQGEVAFISSSF